MMTLASLVGLYAIFVVAAYALIADYGAFDIGALIVASAWPIVLMLGVAVVVWGWIDDVRELERKAYYDD